MKLNYFVPTRIVSGEGCVRSSSEWLAALGHSALIVTGGKSAKLCGALDDAVAALEANGQKWSLFDKVTPNPDMELINAGAMFAKKAEADFVVAIGGGSPMDAGKAIAYFTGGCTPEATLPIAAIPTTAGTGSEVTPYAILTDHGKQTKTSVATDSIFPRLALLDAGYTLTLGAETTVNTAVDALSHAVEGMLTVKANPLTDMIASEAIRTISGILARYKGVSSLSVDDRAELLYASTLAGMVIANTGTTALHALGYCLTYFKDIDHGRANGLLMAEFLRYYSVAAPKPVSKILDLMGIDNIAGVESLMTELLGTYGLLSREEAEKYAGIAFGAKNIQNTAVGLTKADLEDIYYSSI